MYVPSNFSTKLFIGLSILLFSLLGAFIYLYRQAQQLVSMQKDSLQILRKELFLKEKTYTQYLQDSSQSYKDSLEALSKSLQERISKDSLQKLLEQNSSGLKRLLSEYQKQVQEYASYNEDYSWRLQHSRRILGEFQKEWKELLENIEVEKQKVNVIEFKSPDSLRVYYVGAQSEGKASGYGVGLWETGGIYKGFWQNNLRHGLGIYKWKDGEIYEGAFYLGRRNGQGKYIWKDGEYFIGEWKEGKRHGEGTVYYANGQIQYQGLWKDDKFVGKSVSKR